MLYFKTLIHPVGHLYYSRNGPPYQSLRQYRRTFETAGKSGTQIERIISTFQIAESMDSGATFANGRASCVLEIDL